MHHALHLLSPFLAGVMVLNIPISAGLQSQSPQPTGTPRVDPASNQNEGAPSPSPDSTVPSSSATPISPAAFDRDTIVRLKIFLDQHSFGPGEINDHWNDLSANALRLYQTANGRDAAGGIDPELKKKLDGLTSLFMTYQIKSDDLAWVGNSPQKPAAQAKRKFMPYPSLADFVAERFHTSVTFLATLNRAKNLNKLHPGDTVQVPNVPPLEIATLKVADDIPSRPELKTRSVEIDTKNKVLTVMEGGKPLAAFPITPGSKELPAPIGTWQIVKIATLPWFRWDKSMLLHGKRSADFHSIPPGPRNEVGIVWIGLNKKGIGIHGTNNPDSIGRSASHGCIRLANWDAVRVLNAVTQGVTVHIN
jgi:lipoprotein-anchoring transpeptidase ErfK/SrfK